MRSGISSLMKNETPIYELISGAALAIGALFLIIPGFATDLFGFLLIFPITRKLFIKKISNNFQKKNKINKNYIDGEFEDKDE